MSLLMLNLFPTTHERWGKNSKPCIQSNAFIMLHFIKQLPHNPIKVCGSHKILSAFIRKHLHQCEMQMLNSFCPKKPMFGNSLLRRNLVIVCTTRNEWVSAIPFHSIFTNPYTGLLLFFIPPN